MQVELPDGMSEEDVKKLLFQVEKKKEQEKKTGEEKIFGEWESVKDTIKVMRAFFKGKEILSARKFWADEEGNLKPGKGLTFEYDDIEPLIEALTWMQDFLSEEAAVGGEK